MKTAVITGCNRGLGNGILYELLKNDYYVYGLNRTKIKENLENYMDLKCDVTSIEQIREANEIIPNEVDLLIVNSAIRRFNSVEKMEMYDWKDSVDTNLNGAFYVVKEIIPKIKKAEGDIIIIGSHSEKYPFDSGSAYCSTKLALKGFTDCLIEETRYANVRTSYLSLGSIKNREHEENEEWKLMPQEVAKTILSIINLPKKVLVPYIDIRPLKPLKNEKKGIDRLQYV